MSYDCRWVLIKYSFCNHELIRFPQSKSRLLFWGNIKIRKRDKWNKTYIPIFWKSAFLFAVFLHSCFLKTRISNYRLHSTRETANYAKVEKQLIGLNNCTIRILWLGFWSFMSFLRKWIRTKSYDSGSLFMIISANQLLLNPKVY